jgi:DNA repair protein RecN (Recombination protein N)
MDAVELELGPGLNVITGETGAGKSIVVSALELVLGGRGRPELVRGGAKQAEVEALFDVQADPRVRAQLQAMELETHDELVVRRVVLEGGRTRAFINGRLATQQQLAEITRGLADVSSQHEHHTLTDPATHLAFLDGFAGLAGQRQQVASAYQALKRAESQLREFESRLGDRTTRESLLHANIADIEDVAPLADEDVKLEVEHRRMKHADTLVQLTTEVAGLLYDGDDAIVDQLSHAARQLGSAAALEPNLGPLAEQVDMARTQLEETARALSHWVCIPADAESQLRTEDRLYLLSKLKRRFGGTLRTVLDHLEKCRAELDALEDHAGTSDALAATRRSALRSAHDAARVLSGKRRREAIRLADAISRELDSLGMGGARVQVAVRPLEPGAGGFAVDGARLTEDGVDHVEFLIAPNRGEQPRPLHKVASGGELSRSMLAIKCVLADMGPAGMYVFDEVDSGVGGGMAEIIGRKIADVARHRQVLCITHLPQIAVFADHHFRAEKAVRGKRTLSTIRRLDQRERREEVARMLGGLKITAKTRAAARELLQQARSSAA